MMRRVRQTWWCLAAVVLCAALVGMMTPGAAWAA